jgi:hypothetical protein
MSSSFFELKRIIPYRVRERYLKTGLGRITRKESYVGTTVLYLAPLRLLLTNAERLVSTIRGSSRPHEPEESFGNPYK